MYANVTVRWIRHHNPELTVIYDTGLQKTIDLSKYNYHGLHKLFTAYFGVPLSDERSGRALSDDDDSNATKLDRGVAMPHEATKPPPEPIGRVVADERQHSLHWSITDSTHYGLTAIMWLPMLLLLAVLVYVGWSRTRRGRHRVLSKPEGSSSEGEDGPCHVA